MKVSAILFVAMIALMSACSKKDNTQGLGQKPPVVVPEQDQGQPPATPPAATSNENTILQGSWATECINDEFEENGLSFQKVMTIDRNVLGYESRTYDGHDCKAGTVIFVDDSFYAIFEINQISDGVMTHQVDYVTPDGGVEFRWVLRLEGNSFLTSSIDFIESRNTKHYGETYSRVE